MAKRRRSASTSTVARKRSKIDDRCPASASLGRSHILHPLLNKCYHQVKTLKDYLLDALPATSRVRRKRILCFADATREHSELLNGTLVGLFEVPSVSALVQRQQQWAQFTQTRRATQAHSATTQQCTLDEVSPQTYQTTELSSAPGYRFRNLDSFQSQQWRPEEAKPYPLSWTGPLSHLHARKRMQANSTWNSPATGEHQE